MRKINLYIIEKLYLNNDTEVSQIHPLKKGQPCFLVYVEQDKYILQGFDDTCTSLEDAEEKWGERYNKTAEPKIPRKHVKAFYEGTDKEIKEYEKYLRDTYGYA